MLCYTNFAGIKTNEKLLQYMEMKKLRFETLQLHAGQESPDAATNARAVPIYQTASYVFNDCQHAAKLFGLQEPGNIYSRLMNPTSDAFEQRIAALEGGAAALAVASGAAAITYALENVLSPGDHIIAANNLYGGSHNLIANTFKARNISHTFVDIHDADALEKAFQVNTKVVFAETFGNPNSDITDIKKVAEIAHKHNTVFIVDNTFATPFLLRPLELGADVVVHSATKFIGGHGTTMGGVIVDSGKFDFKANADKYPTIAKGDPNYHGAVFADAAPAAPFVTRIRCVLLRDQGACLSPFNSFLLLQGLETLSLRIERHVENALKIVDFLSKHPKVKGVSHPAIASHPSHALYRQYFPSGAASIFTFEIDGGKEEAWKFIDRLKIFSCLANVADAKSLAIHPATTTHSQLSESELLNAGITPSTVRLSIGLEHIDDLIEDIEQALS